MADFELETTRKRIPGNRQDGIESDEFEGVSADNRSWRNWMLGVVGFLYFTGMNMGLFSVGQYIYRRIQVDTYPNKTFETGISFCAFNYSDPDVLRLAHVQERASWYNLLFNIVAGAPAIIMNIILGSYTDKYGRKFLMLLAMSGTLVRILISILGAYTTMNVNLFAIGFAIEGVTGQVFAWLLASYAYVSDITHRKNRAIGIVLNEVGIGLGTSISTLLGGYILQSNGFIIPMIISSVFVVVAILMTVVILPESYPKDKRKRQTKRCITLRHATSFYYSSSSTTYGLRLKYNLSILVFFFTMLTVLGRASIETLYQLNAPFCWTPQKLGLFGALRTILLQVVGMLSVAAFKMCLEDDTIGIIGSISFAVSYIMEGVAKTDAMIYAVTVAGSFGMLTVPMIRSIMSRMTGADRQGALAASISVVETTCQMISNVSLNAIYRSTVAHNRGATFFVMAAFNGVSFILLLILKFCSRKDKDNTQSPVRPISYMDKTKI